MRGEEEEENGEARGGELRREEKENGDGRERRRRMENEEWRGEELRRDKKKNRDGRERRRRVEKGGRRMRMGLEGWWRMENGGEVN